MQGVYFGRGFARRLPFILLAHPHILFYWCLLSTSQTERPHRHITAALIRWYRVMSVGIHLSMLPTAIWNAHVRVPVRRHGLIMQMPLQARDGVSARATSSSMRALLV